MLQSVSLSALQPAAANPRRKIDRKALEGLPPASGPMESCITLWSVRWVTPSSRALERQGPGLGGIKVD